MERNFPVTLLFLLYLDECAIRVEKTRLCKDINDRAQCLISINKFGSDDCVWCPDDLCAAKPNSHPQTCLARGIAEQVGVFDYEDCLRAGTQNGYSGPNYS